MRVFARIGFLSFGGPAAQIALMHRELVEARPWLSEHRYLKALSFCMLLPGPEAMQLATYAGWRLHGTLGGLLAGSLFVLPGAAVMFLLAWLYAVFGDVPLVASLFLGIKAAVLVIVVDALFRVSQRALERPEHWVLAGLAFVALFFLKLPYPLVVVLAGIVGFGLGRSHRQEAAARGAAPDARNGRSALWHTGATVLLWLAIWWLPLLVIGALSGQPILDEIGQFFSRLAVVTFGGAYAVLAYMAQDVVDLHGWLSAGEMLDGLGLAETTPGPLILVTEFVGFLTGYRTGGLGLAMLATLVTLWATFVPCFLWIFAGAPWIDWLNHRPRLQGALAAITAAVVGVILNLSIWFALHVLFASVNGVVPAWASLDWRVLLLTVLSGLLLLGLRWRMELVLLLAAAGGVLSGGFGVA